MPRGNARCRLGMERHIWTNRYERGPWKDRWSQAPSHSVRALQGTGSIGAALDLSLRQESTHRKRLLFRWHEVIPPPASEATSGGSTIRVFTCVSCDVSSPPKSSRCAPWSSSRGRQIAKGQAQSPMSVRWLGNSFSFLFSFAGFSRPAHTSVALDAGKTVSLRRTSYGA
jgi:hypothetical protein